MNNFKFHTGLPVLIFVFFVLMVSFSCKPNEIVFPKTDTLAVYNKSSLQALYVTSNVYFNLITQIIMAAEETRPSKTTCPELSFLPLGANYPKTLTINYGDNCERNGHLFAGKIVVNFKGPLRSNLSEMEATFLNFSMDTFMVSGTILLTGGGFSALNNILNITANVNAELIGMHTRYGTTSTYNIVAQLNNIYWFNDDILTVSTAEISGVNSLSETYVAQLKQSLVYKSSCYDLVSGRMQLQTNNVLYPATLNFGSGTCDDTAEAGTKVDINESGELITNDYYYFLHF